MPSASALNAASAITSSPLFQCSWCGDAIGTHPAAQAEPDNYGICKSCLETQLASLGARKPARSAPRRSATPLQATR